MFFGEPQRGGAAFAFRPQGWQQHMAGKVKTLIEQLIQLRTNGEHTLVAPLKVKLIMKGIDPDMFDADTPDNPLVIQRVVAIAKEMGYELR